MRSNWKRFLALFLAVSMVIASGVFMTTSFRASETEFEASCKHERGEHDDECGAVWIEASTESEFTCGLEESEPIYATDENGTPLEDEDGNLIIESEGHTHTDDCYDEVTVDAHWDDSFCKHLPVETGEHDDDCGYLASASGSSNSEEGSESGDVDAQSEDLDELGEEGEEPVAQSVETVFVSFDMNGGAGRCPNSVEAIVNEDGTLTIEKLPDLDSWTQYSSGIWVGPFEMPTDSDSMTKYMSNDESRGTVPKSREVSFAGWATNPNAHKNDVIESGSPFPAGVTLYAIWTVPVFVVESGQDYAYSSSAETTRIIEVTLGGSETISSSNVEVSEEAESTYHGIGWTYYIFDGIGNETARQVPFGGSLTIESGNWLYSAAIMDETFAFLYDSNAINDIVYDLPDPFYAMLDEEEGEEYGDGDGRLVIVSDEKPKRNKYEFYQWTSSRNGGDVYNPGDKFIFLSINENNPYPEYEPIYEKEVIVYAQWIPDAIVKFNPNNAPNSNDRQLAPGTTDLIGKGSVTTGTTTVTYGPIDISNVNDPVSSKGETFLGWSTDPEGKHMVSGINPVPTKLNAPVQEITLYAQWGKTALEVTKTTVPADKTEYRVGETITYAITVKNSGSIALKDVQIVDETFKRTFTVGYLDKDETHTETLTYTVEYKDLKGADTATFTNEASASGKSSNPDVKDPDPVETSHNVTIKGVPVVATIYGADGKVVYNGAEQFVTGFKNVQGNKIYFINDADGQRYYVQIDDSQYRAWGTDAGTYGKDKGNFEFTGPFNVYTDDGVQVPSYLTEVNAIAGTFIIDKQDITIKSASASAPYGAAEYTIDGVFSVKNTLVELTSGTVWGVADITEIAKASEEGQKLVGSRDNPISITIDGQNLTFDKNKTLDSTTNYNIKAEIGTLTVTDTGVTGLVTKTARGKVEADGKTTHLFALDEVVTYDIFATNIYDRPMKIVFEEQSGVTLGKKEFPNVGSGVTVSTTATYPIDKEDILKGHFKNIVTAKYYELDGTSVNEDSDDETVPTETPGPALTVVKELAEGTTTPVKAGDKISYKITVTNTGNVDLTGVVVEDPLTGLKTDPVDLPVKGQLKPIETEYIVTVADMLKTEIENTATATGKDPNGNDVTGKDNEIVSVSDNKIPLTIKGNEDTLPYTGDIQYVKGFTVNGAEPGNTITVNGETFTIDFGDYKHEASGKDVKMDGEGNLLPYTGQFSGWDSVVIKDKDGKTVTDVFTPNETSGWIKIRPVSVTITPEGGEWVYDGTAHQQKTYNITGEEKAVAAFKKDFGYNEETKKANLNFDFETITNVNESGKPNTITNQYKISTNYDVIYAPGGELKVTPREITLETKTGSADWKESFIDTPFAIPGVTITGEFASGDLVSLEATGKLKFVGSTENTIEISLRGEQKPYTFAKNGNWKPENGNYIIKAELGILTLNDIDKVTKGHNPDPEGRGYFKVGETITFNLTATNPYGTPVTITFTEQLANVTIAKAVHENVGPGETVSTIATYKVIEADVLKGNKIKNVATATFSNGKTGTASDEVRIADLDKGLSITKTALNAGNGFNLGETVTYEIVVSNSGNVTVSDIEVNDGLTKLTTSIASLAPGESKLITTTKVVTLADVKKGSIYNLATVAGKSPGSPDRDLNEQDDVTVEVNPITIPVTITGNSGQVTYNGKEQQVNGLLKVDVPKGYRVDTSKLAHVVKGTNAGTYVGVEEEAFSGDIKVYSTTEKDKNGNDLDVTEFVDPKYTAGTLIVNKRPITITSGDDLDKVYSDEKKVVAENADITYSGEKDADGKYLTFVNGETPVAYGKQEYVGESKNFIKVTVEGKYFEFTKDTVVNDDEFENYKLTVNLGNLKLSKDEEKSIVAKTHDKNRVYKAGEVVEFSITATNIYDKVVNITFNEVTKNVTFRGDSSFENVEPGGTRTAIAVYTITEADVAAGSFINNVTATFTDSDGKPVDEGNDTDEVTEFEKQDASIRVTKEYKGVEEGDAVTGKTPTLGDTLVYQITVINDGDVSLNNVTVTDPRVPNFKGEVDKLLKNETKSFTVKYVVTAEDIAKGSVTNTATATGTPGDGGDDVTDDSESVVVKTGGISLPVIGESKNTVYNGEDQAATGFVGAVTEEDGTVNLEVTDGAGNKFRIDLTEAEYAVTAKDAGEYKDGILEGNYYVYAIVGDKEVDVTAVTEIDFTSGTLNIAKRPLMFRSASKSVNYEPGVKLSAEYLVKGRVGDEKANYENGYVYNDNNELVRDENGKVFSGLVGNETVDIIYDITSTNPLTYVGKKYNTFKVVFNCDPNNYEEPECIPGELEILPDGDFVYKEHVAPVVKEGEQSRTYFKVGETVTFIIKATNIFDRPATVTFKEIDGVILADSEIKNVQPGETVETTATYLVTESAIRKGSTFKNIVTATLTTDDGDTHTDDDDDDVIFDQYKPSIKVTKTANVDEDKKVKVGDEVSYVITVLNNGNIALKEVEVKDALTGDTFYFEKLAVGAEESRTVIYTVKAEDKKDGKVTNKATVTGIVDDPENPNDKEKVKDETEEIVEVDKKYHLTIHYVDEEGKTLVTDFQGDFEPGEQFRVESPHVDGYIPDTSFITDKNGMPEQDMEFTVVYKKTPVVPNPPVDNNPPVIPNPPVDNNPPETPEPPVDNNPPVTPDPPVDNNPPVTPDPPVDNNPPETPETPVTPETPTPETPVTPETPTPETPVTPETPTPETPVTPTTPDAPVAVAPPAPLPVVPGTPQVATTPDNPGAEIVITEDGTPTLVPVEDLETALADIDFGHLCNILYFLMLLSTVVALSLYYRSAKKYNEKIFELRSALGEDDPYLKEKENR